MLAQPAHQTKYRVIIHNLAQLWLVSQMKWTQWSSFAHKFWYLNTNIEQNHSVSKSSIFLKLGLRDQGISCHSRIRNNEEKCYCQTNENIHVYRLQHNVDKFSIYPEVDQMSISTKNEQRNSCSANQSK